MEILKKKIIIGIVIILVVCGFISINILRSKSAGVFSNGKAVEIKTVNARIGDIDSYVSVNGVAQEVDKEEMYLDMSVRVKNVYVEKDQKVVKGQKMFDIDLDDLHSQLAQTKIQLNIQKLQLEKIIGSNKLQNKSQLEASLQNAKTNYENVQESYNKFQKLFDSGAVSKTELDNLESQYNSAKTQYDIAKSNVEDINDNNNDKTSSNEKDIKNQEEQIKLTNISVNDLEKKISKLEKQIYAPIDGIITELNVQKGSLTNPSMYTMKIIDPSTIRVKLELKEVDILKIIKGQRVEITSDSFPNKKIDGEVSSIGAVALKGQGISNGDEAFFEVLVDAKNKDGVLKPGLSVNAKIITVSVKDAVIVPFDTIQEDKDEKKWVFVVDGNTAKMKTIEVGINSELDLEIKTGLLGNEVLVQDPPSRLKDGMKIAVDINK